MEQKTQLLGKVKESQKRREEKAQKEKKLAGLVPEEAEKQQKSERAEREASICKELEEQIRAEQESLELLKKMKQEQAELLEKQKELQTAAEEKDRLKAEQEQAKAQLLEKRKREEDLSGVDAVWRGYSRMKRGRRSEIMQSGDAAKKFRSPRRRRGFWQQNWKA